MFSPTLAHEDILNLETLSNQLLEKIQDILSTESLKENKVRLNSLLKERYYALRQHLRLAIKIEKSTISQMVKSEAKALKEAETAAKAQAKLEARARKEAEIAAKAQAKLEAKALKDAETAAKAQAKLEAKALKDAETAAKEVADSHFRETQIKEANERTKRITSENAVIDLVRSGRELQKSVECLHEHPLVIKEQGEKNMDKKLSKDDDRFEVWESEDGDEVLYYEDEECGEDPEADEDEVFQEAIVAQLKKEAELEPEYEEEYEPEYEEEYEEEASIVGEVENLNETKIESKMSVFDKLRKNFKLEVKIVDVSSMIDNIDEVEEEIPMVAELAEDSIESNDSTPKADEDDDWCPWNQEAVSAAVIIEACSEGILKWKQLSDEKIRLVIKHFGGKDTSEAKEVLQSLKRNVDLDEPSKSPVNAEIEALKNDLIQDNNELVAQDAKTVAARKEKSKSSISHQIMTDEEAIAHLQMLKEIDAQPIAKSKLGISATR